MYPLLFKSFVEILSRTNPKGRILEVGSVPNKGSLLTIPSIMDQERVGINMQKFSTPQFMGFTLIEGNGNNMNMFADDEFDCVLSNATLKHDSRFWLTIAEIKRVLKPGGLAVIGVPGFVKDADISKFGNLEYRINGKSEKILTMKRELSLSSTMVIRMIFTDSLNERFG